MHISDGVLPGFVAAAGYILTLGLTGILIRKIDGEALPRISVVTAIFFVASLIHIPLGITSIHLILNGLVGILLGWDAFVSIFLGVTLQTLLFQHGGLTTIGINTAMMGISALIGAAVFDMRRYFINEHNLKLINLLFGGFVGALCIIISAFILSFLLMSSGENFLIVSRYALLAQLPLMIGEGLICAFVASFLSTVKPELLERRRG